MKRSSKIIALVLALVMVLLLIPVTTVSAAKIPGGTVLYLVPSANWNQSNARFAAYFFGDGEAWVSMTKVAGESNLYQVTAPAGKNFSNVIFCRMNPSATANNWNNKWNQTSDLTYNGTSNCYTVKEGTWDKGGGTWSTYGSACAHTNVGAAATCTTAQVCLDCGDPVANALGHTYNSAHLCTRCNEQAAFTVAGSGAHLGTEWDTGNTANDMTYADGVYTKVYTNVAAGSYLLKVVRDHDWGTAYPSADKAYTVATSGSTVTITLKGTAVTVTVEVPHTCSFSDPTCTEPGKCSCGLTQGEALGHQWTDATYFAPKTCSVCGATEGEALVAVAQIGETRYGTFEEAFAALEEGGTITLLSTYVVGAGTTLLNNITIEASADFYPAIRVIDGGFVVMNNVTLKTGDYGVVLGASDGSSAGNLEINGGKFECAITVVSVTKGELVINGGEFSATPYEGNYSYLLNCIDANYADGSAVIKVIGGTFHNWNPADNAAEGVHTNFVVEGYVSEDNGDGTWTVSKYVPPHEHSWSDATCTEPAKCECGETQGEALGHTAGAEATCTTAQTCTVCGVELVAKLGHVDANLDVDCDREGCTGKVAPPADTVLSAFTANNLGSKLSTSGSYYVIGTIVEVLDQKNGVFLIDDGSGETFYFRLPKNAEGVSHASWEIKLTLGDKVQVYGKINKYSTNTAPNGQYWPAIQSGVVTVLEQHAHFVNGEIVCTKDTLCACGAVVAPATGHIDADENGLCDACNWDMNLVEVHIAIGTDAKYNGVVTNGDDGKALYWTWSAEGFDAIIHKGTSTVTVYTTAKDYMQLKKQNTLTIVNKEDVTIKSIVISVTNATYLGHLKTALSGQYEYTADEVNFTVTIPLNSAEDFVMENKASSTIYVNGVTVVYAKKGAHVHEFKETITTPATCTEAGVKTFACECGEGTYTEVIEALGHNFVEGVCLRCEEKDPNYVPPCAHKDTGLDAKCDVCGEYFLPTSPFKLEMYQATKKETYYFTGSMSGYYFATSTDITKAVDLYAEAVEGGYNVYFMSGSTKNYLYIELSGTHINAKFGSTQAVWYVDETYGALVTEVDGVKYFLGTYSSYVTFGGTAYSRLTSATADVSQYVGRAVSLEEHECTNTTSAVTAPTCTAQGYTTYKCADCGLSTKADYVDALGHTAGAEATCTTAQTCTVCGAELVAALGHSYEAVVTAPTCTESGYTTYTCACGDTYTGDETDALGHTAGAEATCTTAQTCTVCGTELAKALGHNVTDATCTEPAKCTVCGEEKVGALGHSFAFGACTRCEEADPDYVAPQPPVGEPELNFFQQLIAWLVEFLNKFLAIFKK